MLGVAVLDRRGVQRWVGGWVCHHHQQTIIISSSIIIVITGIIIMSNIITKSNIIIIIIIIMIMASYLTFVITTNIIMPIRVSVLQPTPTEQIRHTHVVIICI